MGKDKKKAAIQEQQNQITQTALTQAQNSLAGPSQTEQQFTNLLPSFTNAYQQSVGQAQQDYGNIMGGYQSFLGNIPKATNFSYQTVTPKTPEELNEAYGYLREAIPGYREFAATGGYSNKDIQELRARGTSPIRTAYANTMQELDRTRAIGGGYSPGYTAAISRAQRELPQQIADEMTNVNARLAEDIRQGKLAGLAGVSGIGSTMGGFASEDANRGLQAQLANQSAALQAAQLSEQSLQNRYMMQLQGLEGERGLYGTSPGMASTFGNQALNAWGQSMGAENARAQNAANYLGMANSNINSQLAQKVGTRWLRKALVAASAGSSTYFTGGALGPAAGGIYGAVAGT